MSDGWRGRNNSLHSTRAERAREVMVSPSPSPNQRPGVEQAYWQRHVGIRIRYGVRLGGHRRFHDPYRHGRRGGKAAENLGERECAEPIQDRLQTCCPGLRDKVQWVRSGRTSSGDVSLTKFAEEAIEAELAVLSLPMDGATRNARGHDDRRGHAWQRGLYPRDLGPQR
jgi:hypothetical protein